MLKSSTSRLMILVAGVLFLTLFIVGSILAVEYYEPTQWHAEQEAKNQTEAKAIDILASERVAYYTKVLAIFTGVLSGFGFLQIGFLIRADKITRKSANAAQMAAEALPIVERAYVYPVIAFQGNVQDCIRSAHVFYMDRLEGDADTPSPETAEVSFRIKNLGKTPAVLTSVEVIICTWSARDEGYEILPIAEAVLGANETTETAFTSRMARGLSRNQAQGILSLMDFLVFRGRITFNDIWNYECVTEFVFHWRPDGNRWETRKITTSAKQQ